MKHLKLFSKRVSRMGHRMEYRALLVCAGAVLCGLMEAAAQATGTGAFTQATQTIKDYKDPVTQLMYAIAAVIAIVGAFNVYFKMQNGDQDVKKTIMMTLGGCIAFVALATALPMFFGV